MTGKSEKKEKKDTQSEQVAELQKKLEESEAKTAEYLQMAQRLQADFDNFRKRTAKEKPAVKCASRRRRLKVIEQFCETTLIRGAKKCFDLAEN